ncbi:MAG: O-antigen ligase family protein [Shewanella sp.]
MKTAAIGDSFNYLSFADKFAILSIFLIAFSSTSTIKSVLFIFSVLILYIVGSRSSLVFFIISGMAYLFFKKPRMSFFYLSILIVALSFFSKNELVYYFGLVPKSERMIARVIDSSNDASEVGRAAYLSSGLDDIQNNPITGDFLGQVKKFGTIGSWIHNGLSYWHQFGLMVFVIYVMVCAINLFMMASFIFDMARRSENKWFFYFSTCLFSMLSTALTRTAFSPETFFFIMMPFAMYDVRYCLVSHN